MARFIGLDVDCSDFYLKKPESARPSISEIFLALSGENTYPAIYHCLAGEQRTGALTALIPRGLGGTTPSWPITR